MLKISMIVTFIGSIISAFYMLNAIIADGFPEMAARAAIALGFVVIPYCVSRVLYMDVMLKNMKEKGNQ